MNKGDLIGLLGAAIVTSGGGHCPAPKLRRRGVRCPDALDAGASSARRAAGPGGFGDPCRRLLLSGRWLLCWWLGCCWRRPSRPTPWTRASPRAWSAASAFGIFAVGLGLICSWYARHGCRGFHCRGRHRPGCPLECGGNLITWRRRPVRHGRIHAPPRFRVTLWKVAMKSTNTTGGTGRLAVLVLAGCSRVRPATLQPARANRRQAWPRRDRRGGRVAEPQLHLVAIDAAGKASMLDLLNGTDTQLETSAAAGQCHQRWPLCLCGQHSRRRHHRQRRVDLGSRGPLPLLPGRTRRSAQSPARARRPSPRDCSPLLAPRACSSRPPVPPSLSKTPCSRTEQFPRLSAWMLNRMSGIIAPLGDGAVVTEADENGKAARLRAIDATGKELTTTGCPAAAGTITTRVGLVIGCADGAVIATRDGTTPVLEHVPYPAAAAAAPATTFEGRKGRPTVAGIGTDAGVWLLNTRERNGTGCRRLTRCSPLPRWTTPPGTWSSSALTARSRYMTQRPKSA